MISRFLKIISLVAFISLVGISVIFSSWEIPVKQQQIDIEIDSSNFLK